MAYRFDLDVTHRILRGQLVGQVTDDELVEFYREIERQCGRINPRAGVVDCSAVTTLAVTAQTVRELAKLPPSFSDPATPRFIVAPAPGIYGLARMFQFEGEITRPNLHVVQSLREVLIILGVSGLRFEPMQTE